MRRRERRAVVRLIEHTCAPRPPLPPVEATDAVAAYERWLAAAPRLNRVAVRTLVLAGAHPEPLRAIASFAYYGDPQVAEVVGYAPRAR